MSEPVVWRFTAAEAADAAHEVVWHRARTPWSRMPVPADDAAAEASVHALAEEFERIPASFLDALDDSGSNAALISDDPLQGLAELLQNADDADATHAFLTVDPSTARLAFGHNGADLTLPDVWGLTLPWVSQKSSNAKKIGRFGIGLKTLQMLADTLEVHNAGYRLRLGAASIALAPPVTASQYSLPISTEFIVPMQNRTLTQDEVADWLATWGDAGLLFLSSLRTVTLVTPSGTEVTRLHLDTQDTRQLEMPHGPVTRRTAKAEDETWVVYERDALAPATGRRRKAKSATTPVAIAYPLSPDGAGNTGHLHIGLPVRAVGLPFRVSGQFDPTPSRQDITSEHWNLELLGLVADLWVDSCADMFSRDARTGWGAVPLVEELEADSRTTGAVRERLSEALMRDARLELGGLLQLRDSEGTLRNLSSLAYETSDLTNILSPDDVRKLAGTDGTIAHADRSSGDRWRAVLNDLDELGADTPGLVDAGDAVELLDEPDRATAFLADLTQAVLRADDEDGELAEDLIYRSCLVLDDETRATPESLTGIDALPPEDATDLWSTLALGKRIHPEFAGRPSWDVVAAWLRSVGAMHSSGTDLDALQALARAGRVGESLPRPLTDEQAFALRDALEDVPEVSRPALGQGVGRAVLFDATRFSSDGTRVQTHAHPADAYFIESVRGAFAVAAKTTPGLTWLHRRYNNDLRSPRGRHGLAAQALFRLLGAAVGPRLEKHPGSQIKYGTPGLSLHHAGAPRRRAEQMNAVKATHTLGDRWSPDLDRVLTNIAKEKRSSARRERVDALLGCLSRHWDDYSDYTKVESATGFYQWNGHGRVDAWWVSSAASFAWLVNGRGRPSAPGDLLLRTVSNEALHGDDPTLYVAGAFDTPANREALIALGVEGNPSVTVLLDRIADIRAAYLARSPLDPSASDGAPMTTTEAADAASVFYKALANEVQTQSPRRLGSLTQTAAREIVNRGDGLIITSHGWRRSTAVLAGPPIFGEFRAFVPSVTGTEPLWSLLGVRGPSVDDAKDVAKEIARDPSPDTDRHQIVRECLRIIADTDPDRCGRLLKFPVWIGSEWSTRRPVYAVGNPLLAEALADVLAVWQPGGQLPLTPLAKSLGLTSIDSSHASVQHAPLADYDTQLTGRFRCAVRNLQTDLAVSAPSAERSIRVTWEALAQYQVAVFADLEVQVTEPLHKRSHIVAVDAWLDPETATLYVATDDETGRARSGGYAVATMFDANVREIAHAWGAAWADVEDGYLPEVVESAAEQAAKDAQRRADSDAALRDLVHTRPPRKQSAKKDAKKTRAAPTPARAPAARTLVDVDSLVELEPDGEKITDGGSTKKPPHNGKRKPKLRDPDAGNQPKPSGGGRGPTNYGPGEKEETGLRVLRKALGKDETTLHDVRHQPDVGADAVDDEGRFFELKVHGTQMQDVVKMEGSQIERALSTDKYYLVVIGNVENTGQPTEVRLIHDPLHQLKKETQSSVHLSGVLSAQARVIRYGIETDSEDEET
jgi:hypothetical protein